MGIFKKAKDTVNDAIAEGIKQQGGNTSALKNQMRSVIQWDDPQEFELFYKFTDRGDEIKNASKLIIQPGQGCIFTYEGKIEGIFDEEGMYDIKTSNIPFLTTIKKIMYAFESNHKTGFWFYRKADILNVRWGTKIPITYNDPVYLFPVSLRGFGNYSIRISDAKKFFTEVLAAKENYFIEDLQEIFLSRITQPIANYLANAKFSYAEIDSHIVEIANHAKLETVSIFEELGFNLTDFRIEGTSFEQDTQDRINGISDVHAEAQAAKLAGVDYSELQRLKALRDAAKNEGTAGAGMGIFAGVEMGKTVSQQPPPTAAPQPTSTPSAIDVKSKLKELKSYYEEDLISEEEYNSKKQELLKDL